MCAFGRAFLPILTQQEGTKGEGRRDKGIKEDVWIPAYFMQGLAQITRIYKDLLPRKGTKCTKRTKREKSLSGNRVIRKWVSGEQENREYSVKRISLFEAGKRGIL